MRILAVVAVLAASGCDMMQSRTIVPLSASQIAQVKSAFAQTARNPGALQFRNIRGVSVQRERSSELVACGEVNGQNGFGGFTGFNPFYYNFTKGFAVTSNREIGGTFNAGQIGVISAYCG